MSNWGGDAIRVLALLLTLAFPSGVWAAETLMSLLSWQRSPAQTFGDGNSVRLKVVPMPPSHQFEQPKRRSRQPSTATEVPRYEYGYFGARYHYKGGSHVGYYGDTIDWWFKKH
jgi:class 3 adenylate cyclase